MAYFQDMFGVFTFGCHDFKTGLRTGKAFLT